MNEHEIRWSCKLRKYDLDKIKQLQIQFIEDLLEISDGIKVNSNIDFTVEIKEINRLVEDFTMLCILAQQEILKVGEQK